MHLIMKHPPPQKVLNKRSQIENILMRTTPQTDEHLHKYIKNFVGFHLARNAVCPGHCAPFSFMADSFFQRGKSNKLVIAPRDAGGKTRALSILNSLYLKFYPNCETAVIGAILEQAKKGYSYLQEYHNKPFIGTDVIRSIMSSSSYNNGSKCGILTGTVSGVNSPHPNKLLWDEIDLTDKDILQQGFSMPHTTGDIKAQIILATTRKHSGVSKGTAQEIIDKINEGLLPFFDLYMWCIFEVIQNCKFQNCSKCEDIIRYGEDGKAESFASVCQGKAKLADGHYPISDVWERFTNLDANIFDTEWLCKRAGRSGRMFPAFSEEVHVVEGYRHNINLPTFAGQDFGFSNPAVTEFCQVDSSDNIFFFDEIVETEKTDEQLSKDGGAWKTGWNKYEPLTWACDPENPTAIQTMKNNGIKNAKGVRVPRLDSIGLIRRWLRPPNSPKPKIFISRKCKKLIHEMLNWQKRKDSEDGKKENDHAIDATRYICWYLFGKQYLALNNKTSYKSSIPDKPEGTEW